MNLKLTVGLKSTQGFVILDSYMIWFFVDIECIVLNKVHGTLILDSYLYWLFPDIGTNRIKKHIGLILDLCT